MLRLSLLLLLLSQSGYSLLLGWVESPGYPIGYLPHSSLNWSRCAPKGHTLSIRLVHLDLEDSQGCESDGVKVFSDGSLVSLLCGKREFEELESTVNPLLVSNPGGCLSLFFHSDYSNTRRYSGFRGFYTIQDYNECEDDPENGCTQFCHNWIGGYHCSCRHGYHLDADKHTCTVSCTEDLSGLRDGDISSPSWPGSYAENARCVYTLSVETHQQLELHFSEIFDVEQGPDGQCIDTLTIKTHSGKLGPFCGHTPPPSPLLTHSHRIQIHFKTDGFGTNKGFHLHFQTRGKVCPSVVSPHSTVSPLKPEYHEDEVVTVTCDVGYVANTEGAKIMTSDYVSTCQRTGVWSPGYICEPVDCGFPDLPEDGILIVVGSGSLYRDQIQFNCTSKYYALDRDDSYTCSASGEWVTTDGNTEFPKCIETCGMPKNPSSAGRIIGGSDASLGEIPWHLLIKEPRRGGASLINDRWAVTAAHVVEGLEETSLRLYGGLVDGRTAENRFSDVVSLDSERIIIHPGYTTVLPSTTRTNYDNDIALIRFNSKVNLGPNLRPICLPEGDSDLTVNEMGIVSGWGATERGFKSAKLKYAQIGVYSLERCQDTPTLPPNHRMTFTDNMFCAGYQGRDSCEMDSGGPFSVQGGTGKPYHLMGIVSWGPPCRERQYKGYYTKVANYVDWIKNTIETVESS